MRSPRMALVLPLLVTACPHEHGPGEAAVDFFYDCNNAPAGVTTYATDESLVEIINKEAAGEVQLNEAEAATLLAPEAGSTLSPSTPPMFMLRTPTAALVPARPGGCPPPARRWWQRLSPIGTAHAHCPGVTGDNVLFRLTPEGSDQAAYTATLSVAAFTPNAERWRAALAGHKGKTLRLTLLRAGLQGGRVTVGPFTSAQTVRFTVGE